ncbi:MAG: DUF63 family protein [Halolamina sp.]
MSTLQERIDASPGRFWLATVGSLFVALVGGSLLFPETVYDGFIWHYFWGPVQADAHNAVCAIRPGSEVQYLYDSAACSAAAEPIAEPGYTLVSEVGYVVTLLLTITGTVLMLERLDVGKETSFFWAMVPFMLLGSGLRVIEDAHNSMPDGGGLTYPLNTLFISPIIYITVFVVALACLLLSIWLARQGSVERYDRPLAAMGTVVFLLSLGYLSVLAVTSGNPVTFYPQVLVAVLALAGASTAVTWYAIERFVPYVHEGTRDVGVMVLLAHAVDGAANVVALDYMMVLGAGGNLYPKHPVNEFIVDTAGAAWPFLVVKMVAAAFVLWIFEPELYEESPRYTTLLLIAVTAVGLGPGTRDLFRAMFGV